MADFLAISDASGNVRLINLDNPAVQIHPHSDTESVIHYGGGLADRIVVAHTIADIMDHLDIYPVGGDPVLFYGPDEPDADADEPETVVDVVEPAKPADISALRGSPFQSKARSSDEYAINHNGAEAE